MKTPINEMAKSRPELFKKIFTKEAIIMPIKPMIKKDPKLVKSRFVVYPYRLMLAKIDAVMKNKRAMLSPV